MVDYVYLGTAPIMENCAQVGEEDYEEKVFKEMERYKKQIIKMFGEPPKGAKLRKKAFSHDFGIYYGLVVAFDNMIDEAVIYATRVEGGLPEYWY